MRSLLISGNPNMTRNPAQMYSLARLLEKYQVHMDVHHNRMPRSPVTDGVQGAQGVRD